MSNPSFSNIDRWLFELVEGNLSPEQEAQLKAFIMLHPELDIDLDAWEHAHLKYQKIDFPDKHRIQKRRPVGLYMSLGFSFMVGLIVVGIVSQFSELEGFYGKNLLEEVSLFNSLVRDPNGKSVRTEKMFNTNSNKKNLSESTLENYGKVTDGLLSEPNTHHDNLVADHLHHVMTSTGSADLHTSSSIVSSGPNAQEWNLEKQGGSLKTQKVKPITSSGLQETAPLRDIHNPSIDRKKIVRSAYHRSLSTRVHNVTRALERMLDNPIALRNQNDPYYHIPGMQATDINFGAVGTLLSTRVQTVTRAQWYGMENQQWMNQLSVDGYAYSMRGGIGFQLNQNYYGDGTIQNYHAALTYSPKFSVSRNVVLEPSIRFKMGSKELDAQKIQSGEHVEFDRMNDQQFSMDTQFPMGRTLWYRDLGLGMMINTRWFFAGIQQDNLFRHFDNIYSQDLSDPRRAPKHFVACVGSDYKSMRQKITISPYVVYQREDQLSEAWAGFNFRVYWLSFGGAISSNLDPAASAGIKLKNFMVQYNMDLTRSSMLNKQLLSHQLTLRFTTKAGRVGQRLLN